MTAAKIAAPSIHPPLHMSNERESIPFILFLVHSDSKNDRQNGGTQQDLQRAVLETVQEEVEERRRWRTDEAVDSKARNENEASKVSARHTVQRELSDPFHPSLSLYRISSSWPKRQQKEYAHASHRRDFQ